MKPNISRKTRIWLLLVMTVLTGQEVLALSPRSRPAEGLLVDLKLTGRSLGFQPSDQARPVEFTLTRQTRFLRNQTQISASELKPGARVVVFYRSPFFGRPFITKVVWRKMEERE